MHIKKVIMKLNVRIELWLLLRQHFIRRNINQLHYITLNKIIEELEKQGKNQKELCDFLGIGKQNFSDWKKGKSKSYQKYLPQIALFLNVSIDYLANPTMLNPNPQVFITYKGDNQIREDLIKTMTPAQELTVKQIFIKLCSDRNESPSQVCKKIGISPAAFSQWNDKTIPRFIFWS